LCAFSFIRDQALLVDFEDFANSLISLMQLCWSVDEDHGGDIPHQYSSGNVWDTTNRAEVQWGNAAWDGPQQQHNQQRVLGNASPYSQHYTMRNSSSYSRPPVSTYTCRLETSTQASNTTNNTQCRKGNIHFTTGHARFTIVESNQFRELTHLALTLNIGTDKSVRQYLSSRLSQAMVQIADVQNHLEIQRQRCEVAERNAINANKRLGDTTQACEAEKYRLQCQAEERFQTESSCRLAEFDSIKAAKDTEIQALKDELQRCKLTFDDKVRLLEESNRKINEEKSSCQSEKDRLSSQLGQQETANRLLANEVSSLRARLERITEEKSATEKNLSELQLLLASVETTTNAHQNTINQSEAHIASTERVYADAKLTISRQHSQINELQRRLAESESEATRYKELAGRYQSNRAEMKKQIKEKAETIRQQEDTIRDGEKEMIETKHRVESLSGNLKRTQAEKEAAMNELTASKKMLDEATKKLDNNQQVRAWLQLKLK
jgi:spindle assembly abnormal protein 6